MSPCDVGTDVKPVTSTPIVIEIIKNALFSWGEKCSRAAKAVKREDVMRDDLTFHASRRSQTRPTSPPKSFHNR